jgi:hypothetical protein
MTRPRVTFEGAARLLGRPGGRDRGGNPGWWDRDDVGVQGDGNRHWELAEQAVQVWPIGAIEESLGREAALILPPGVRTRRFTARLPRHVVAALECLAEENGENAGASAWRVKSEGCEMGRINHSSQKIGSREGAKERRDEGWESLTEQNQRFSSRP